MLIPAARLTLSGFVICMVNLVPIIGLAISNLKQVQQLRLTSNLLNFIANLIPNNDCQKIVPIAEWFMVLSMVLNSLLFVFRVRAVYLNSTKVTVIFGILWLTTLSQLLPPIASELNITDVGEINDCAAILEMKSWVVTGFIFTAAFDTAVFIAISMQVLGFTGNIRTWKERASSFIHGKELGNITRAVLQTGQLYYL